MDSGVNVLFNVMSLTKTLNPLLHSTGSTQEDRKSSQHNRKMADWDEKHQGAQWLSGRVLDSRPKGRGFEPHRRHYVVVLEQDTFILA